MPALNKLRINGVDYDISGGGGGGSVTGVKGDKEGSYRTGNVNLTPANIGALPDNTVIPSKTSDLTNDSNFVSDTNYIHTDNNYTSTEKDKLAGIASGAEVNVQSDWEESDTSSDAYIQHKPTIPTKVSDLANDSGFITGLVVLTVGSATWNDFITAFNANKIVYCREVVGNDSRYAFLAYYNPTESSAEFQYYRSMRTHSQSAQGDEVHIYKLDINNTWTLTTRKTYSNVNVGGGIKDSYYDYQLHLSIDSAYASFTNYYTKSNTYSKTEVDNIVSGLPIISFEIVQTLPQTGETDVIYLVPKSITQPLTQNLYDEYIYINDAWEKIGDYSTNDPIETDLNQGAYFPFYELNTHTTKRSSWSNIEAKLKDKFDDIYATISALRNKVDKVSGKGLSTNDYTTEEKNKLNGIAEGAEVNVQADWNVSNSSSDAYIRNKPAVSVVSWTQNLTAGNLSGVLTINGTDYPVYYERYTAESPWVEYEMPYLNNPEDRYEGVYRFRATSENIHTTNTVEIFSDAPKAVYDSVLIEEGQITVTYRTNQIASTNVVKARVS